MPDPLAYFADMIDHCLAFAEAAKKAGRPVVGIMCEYTPREVIAAAGGVPVCLCGGDADMIPPAEEQLPANLCPLIKSTFGYHATKSNPFLEMADLLVAETTCDGKKKMYELMGETRPMYVMELPQKEDDPDARAHWAAEVRKFAGFLERRWGTTITPQRLADAVGQANRYRALRRRLAEFMASDAPPFTGRQLLDMKSIIWPMPDDLAVYEDAIRTFSNGAPRPDLAGRPRVLLTGVPVVHGAERVVDLIESRGGLVVCMENCTGVKPFLQDVEERGAGTTAAPFAAVRAETTAGHSAAVAPIVADSGDTLLAAIAEKYFQIPCSVKTPNDARLESLGQLARQYRPQCVVELIWQACLTYDVESNRVKRFVEQELRLPYLRISTDYSPGDSARLALRIEALFETVGHRSRGRSCPP